MRLDRHEQIIRERFLRSFYRAYNGIDDAQPSVNHDAFFPAEDVFRLGALRTLIMSLPKRCIGLTLSQRIAAAELMRTSADLTEME